MNLLLVLLLLLGAQSSFANDFQGYVAVEGEQKKLWVDYQAPKANGPLIVLLNGMTYSLKDWAEYKSEMIKAMPDAGFLLYDMRGQGKSWVPLSEPKDVADEYYKVADTFKKITSIKTWDDWRKYWTSGEFYTNLVEWGNQVTDLWLKGYYTLIGSNEKDIHFSVQVTDLHNLIEKFRGNSKVHLVGLSYGGAIGEAYTAKYGYNISTNTMLAPFVAKLPQQDDWVKYQISLTKLFNPYFSPSYETLYLFYLKILVYSTYPLAEPTLLKNPHKTEAAYKLAAGTLDFDGVEIAKSSDQSKTYLVVAGNDEYVPPSQHEALWESLKKSGAQARIIIENADHKINLRFAKSLAEITQKIVYKTDFSGGQTYKLNGKARSIINCQGLFL